MEAVATDGIKKSTQCFETITQLCIPSREFLATPSLVLAVPEVNDYWHRLGLNLGLLYLLDNLFQGH